MRARAHQNCSNTRNIPSFKSHISREPKKRLGLNFSAARPRNKAEKYEQSARQSTRAFYIYTHTRERVSRFFFFFGLGCHGICDVVKASKNPKSRRNEQRAQRVAESERGFYENCANPLSVYASAAAIKSELKKRTGCGCFLAR